ncbi:L-lactate permease [Phytoactinopolyspora halotolerans]|uniref:L-lactate permease n=1 Tax=Phytoactinopolyspora halotolerans TaxID=1981512 RepID=A0A6L9SEU2_9ACTN|nr:L-lactate permease [Phytoactinopolyspora halotolerans]NEE03011.1 L-lactate permease [Phytoactinopolyspora halotolerans]
MDGYWFAALVPVLTLFLLVLLGRLKTTWSAAVTLATALVLALTVFAAPVDTVATAAAKGLWLGTWILCVVVPALLLYRLAHAAGMDRLGETFTRFLPRRTDRLLLLAWIFPSFVQGVAGFGTPIAVCAPLLLMLGYDKVRAVVLPLVGYHWSVTFGSMGSSFYMASLTAGFSGSSQDTLALEAGVMLAVNAIVAGLLVLLIDGGLRQLRRGWLLLVTAGAAMAGTLVVVATAVPAIASLAAGTAGLLVLTGKRLVETRRTRATVPDSDDADTPDTSDADSHQESPAAAVTPAASATVLAPYGFLLLVVLPVFLTPPIRDFVRERFELAPSFGRTVTDRGWVNEPVDHYLPIPLLGHPGFYILLACLLGWITYRVVGLWRGVDTGHVVRSWLSAVAGSAPTTLMLGTLAMVLVDSGMVTTLADGIADTAGSAYPVFSPVVGALGSFMTGSSTSSNALFAALQAEVAGRVGVEPELLVAAQATGANVGNSIAPVIILIGATAVGALDRVGQITRRALLPMTVLLAVVIGGVVVQASVF